MSGAAYTDTLITYGANENHGVTATFDGAASVIDTGGNVEGVGDITILFFLTVTTDGEGGTGRICDNGKMLLFTDNIVNGLGYSRQAISVDAQAANNSMVDGFSGMGGFSRTSGGICNFYVNGELSGTANQSAGANVAGTHTLLIGNNSATTRAFDGNMRMFVLYNKILTQDQIRQVYNKFK